MSRPSPLWGVKRGGRVELEVVGLMEEPEEVEEGPELLPGQV